MGTLRVRGRSRRDDRIIISSFKGGHPSLPSGDALPAIISPCCPPLSPSRSSHWTRTSRIPCPNLHRPRVDAKPHTEKPLLSPQLDQECKRRVLERPPPGIGPPLYRCGTAHRCNSAGDAVLSPMTFPPCPPVAPLIRWSLPRMYHRNGRQMTTHTGSAIQDLLLGPDSGMSECGSYDSATMVSQISQAPDTKCHFSDTNGVTSQLRTGHAGARLQL